MGQEGVNKSVLNNETEAEMLLVFWWRWRGGEERVPQRNDRSASMPT